MARLRSHISLEFRPRIHSAPRCESIDKRESFLSRSCLPDSNPSFRSFIACPWAISFECWDVALSIAELTLKNSPVLLRNKLLRYTPGANGCKSPSSGAIEFSLRESLKKAMSLFSLSRSEKTRQNRRPRDGADSIRTTSRSRPNENGPDSLRDRFHSGPFVSNPRS